MASISFHHVYKKYGNKDTAVDDFHLSVEDKEFVVLVGPSGCGKSTTLRMLAGLEDISEGEIFIGDKKVNPIPPKDRDISMVFQNYALYPNMSVYENIAFGLRLRKLPKHEIDLAVKRAARVLEIGNYLNRKPRELSGGQRQRVALGRAIVRTPQVFLMDEPLSNLDAKLRVQMRTEIIGLQRKIGVTTIYVTHDQIEAMTMGDRVVVMNRGVIQQVATPETIYNRPVNMFVAGFIGNPPMNFIEGKLEENEGELEFGTSRFSLRLTPKQAAQLREHNLIDRTVIMGIRAEHMSFDDSRREAAPRCVISGAIRLDEFIGSDRFYHLDIKKEKNLIVRAQDHVRFDDRSNVSAAVNMEKALFFSKDTELLLTD
ncbi:ABC transporter ATP-binding protein [Paenibacillus spongiae]|uniref:Sn-glycerol-3-phosphate ABC transporter ATP-binding protein UgpC n=1 Tax=Paenibacillus spongiae TaxID=2909671 RepID=A0ABY5SBR4_9BACL|nr:sn-glycerol-3-phosphate ABC transporter ATP-binding protein UgpC [Paenibacillus spongiae]UVI30190.1 sn-glycerol-3-phosphate ABC transporter ATP-binding protein UgpC [Paenibacillus spongiae]